MRRDDGEEAYAVSRLLGGVSVDSVHPCHDAERSDGWQWCGDMYDILGRMNTIHEVTL